VAPILTIFLRIELTRCLPFFLIVFVYCVITYFPDKKRVHTLLTLYVYASCVTVDKVFKHCEVTIPWDQSEKKRD